MTAPKKSYRATVVCEVRVAVTDSWGDDCTMAQIEKQASDSARGVLSHLLDSGHERGDMSAMYQDLHRKAIGKVSVLRVVSVEAKSS